MKGGCTGVYITQTCWHDVTFMNFRFAVRVLQIIDSDHWSTSIVQKNQSFVSV